MKKPLRLFLFMSLVWINHALGQVTTFVEAPPYDNSTSSNRSPNGTAAHAFMRACALVLQSELTGIPTNSNITAFGFTLNSGTSVNACTGNFTLYLQNTTDATYQKGTSWATIPTGMQVCYASVMTVPISVGAASISVTLSAPFLYTGGGLYVAYDWNSAGPYGTNLAVYRCNSFGLVPGCASAAGASAPTTLGTSAFRPCYLFGIANQYTNEIVTVGIEAPGRVPAMFATSHSVNAVILNGSNITKTNIGVNLNITGANALNTSQNITSLAAGATTVVSFPFNPLIAGLNTISVSVAADQNNVNNSATYAQSVTCNEWSQNPASGTYTAGLGFPVTFAGTIASIYVSPVASTLSGLRLAVSTDVNTPGNAMWGVLLNAAGAAIATTNTVSITNPMLGTTVSFSFATPQPLTSGTTYHFGFVQSANATLGYLPFGTQAFPYVPPISYIQITSTGATLPATSFGHFGIHGIFTPTLTVNAVPSSAAICIGDMVTITASGSTSYTWTTPGGTVTGSGISDSPISNTSYTVATVDALTCKASTVVTIQVNPLPNVNAVSSHSAICLGNSATLTATGASTYAWSSGANTAVTIESPVITTVYTATGTSAAGCVNTKTVEVIVNSFTPGISTATAICFGNGILLTATGGSAYVWNSSMPFAAITVSPGVTTNYSVTATGLNGCPGSAVTTVTVNPLPVVTATVDRVVMCNKEFVTISAGSSSALTYSWSGGNAPTAQSQTVAPPVNTTLTYTVVGTDPNGCINSANVSVQNKACTGIDAHTTSSGVNIYPNPGNGMFHIEVADVSVPHTVYVFDAVGKMVFSQGVVTSSETLNLQHLSNGLYIVKLMQNSQEVDVLRLIKQ